MEIYLVDEDEMYEQTDKTNLHIMVQLMRFIRKLIKYFMKITINESNISMQYRSIGFLDVVHRPEF
jgi:hypothetical protein